MIPMPNDGSRPSRLMLDRYATGELSAAEAAEIEAWVATDPEARAHLDAIEAAKAEVAPFDATALRERSGTLAPTGRSVAPANNNRGFLAAVPVFLMAALALVFAWPMLTGVPDGGAVDPSYVGVRGNGTLEAYHLGPDGLKRYDQRALGEGDVLGFKVDAAQHEGVVVLSVDSSGQVSVHWPAAGDAPEKVAGSGVVALPGSVILDGAPGPEIFVAVFDTPVSKARADAERAWQAGGAQGLSDWAHAQTSVDLSVVNRK